MSELVDSLMDGEALVMDLAGTREALARYVSMAYAEWSGVRTFNRLDPHQEYARKLTQALCAMTDAAHDLDQQLRKLDDVLHRELSKADPDGTLDCDITEFARKAAGR